MTEDDFITAWKMAFGYETVTYETARKFKMQFIDDMDGAVFIGMLSRLKQKNVLLGLGDHWRLFK